jgi:hypothetical protein
VDERGTNSGTTCPTEGRDTNPANVLARVECKEEAVGCAPLEDTPWEDIIGAMERVFTTLAFDFFIRLFAILFACFENEVLATPTILGTCFKVSCLKSRVILSNFEFGFQYF